MGPLSAAGGSPPTVIPLLGFVSFTRPATYQGSVTFEANAFQLQKEERKPILGGMWVLARTGLSKKQACSTCKGLQ